MVKRCDWTGSDPLMVDYHDREWGVPVHDDRLLFEFLVLEGAQAGLSWATILRKRDNYRAAFDSFDITRVAAYDDSKVAALLSDPGIVRNRLKVRTANPERPGSNSRRAGVRKLRPVSVVFCGWRAQTELLELHVGDSSDKPGVGVDEH